MASSSLPRTTAGQSAGDDVRQEKPLHLISVAHRKTLPVLRYGHAAILDLIPAASYTVLVPDDQVSEFREILDSRFSVKSEEEYVRDLRPMLLQKYTGAPDRFGWYLQQFIKLSAVERHTRLGNVVIWDADTIPLRRLQFFNSRGLPAYFVGSESHAPYFEAIRRAIGLQKKREFSFVSQCFPVASHHAAAFFGELQGESSQSWWAPLIDSIDFAEQSGFSEYETLGTFIADRFPWEFSLQEDEWLRNGWKAFSGPKEASTIFSRWLWAGVFAHCSFELHQAPTGGYPLKRRLFNFARFQLRRFLPKTMANRLAAL